MSFYGDEEGVSDDLTAQVWNEHIAWKRDAVRNLTYDNSPCTAVTADDWPKCQHCKDEVRRVHIEIGRRANGEENWQSPPFVMDSAE